MVRLSDEIVMSAVGERQLAENVDVNDSPLHQDSDSTDSPYDTEDRIPRGKYKKHVDCKIYRPEKPKKLVEHLDMDLQECYDMGSFPRGVLVVFNMHTFTATTGLEDYPRKGTSKDANDLRDTFLELGFVVIVYDDPTEKKIMKVLQQVEVEYSTLSCFGCAVLSHGEKDYFYAHDSLVKLADIFSLLESPFWVGKPKIFLIQACQGDEYMDGIEPNGLDEVDAPPSEKIDDMSISLPRQSDFLYAYSTAAGYSSWRNTANGSWFVQEVCNSIQMYSKRLDLSRILTRANNAIALRMTETQNVEMNGKRQIASVVNQLRKDLYFRSPYEFGRDEVDEAVAEKGEIFV